MSDQWKLRDDIFGPQENDTLVQAARKAANLRFPKKEMHECTAIAYDFFLKGAQWRTASPQQEEGWINVKDRLPDLGDEVICYCPDSRHKVTALCRFNRYEGAINFYWDNHYGGSNVHIQESVTHWKPLPSLPEAKEGDVTDINVGDIGKESKKIIAVFDGWEHVPTPKGKGKGYWNKTDRGYAHWDLSSMKYNSSWDWLMPVVYSLSVLLTRFVFVQNQHSTIIRGSNGKLSFDFYEEGTNLETAFNVVVKAVQWYNEQNTKLN